MILTTEDEKFFKKRINRFCVSFLGYGFIPVACGADDKPIFISGAPKRIGDDAVIFAEGKKRKVRLLRSNGHIKDETYLVDMGPA